MSPDIAKVSPSAIRWKVSADVRTAGAEAIARLERLPVEDTDKQRSIALRYVDGVPWEETPLFQNIYRRRLQQGDSVRQCSNWDDLLEQYRTRVDALFADLKSSGWRDSESPIPVYVAHDGALLMGNQGNHRAAMARILNLPYVVVEIAGKHAHAPFAPDLDLPDSARSIPAMTTEAERQCYYRLTREQSGRGAVVELGAWLGASTAYIAAGMRDSGVANRVHVYDRFVWKPSSHDVKAGGPIRTTQLEAFKQYLGPLLNHVDVHVGEVSRVKWTGGNVSLLICDAPKRVPEIASVLAAFSKAMTADSLMVWQDFGYFPSYDIPAVLTCLRSHVEFVEGVYPGTTAVFRVIEPWHAKNVSASALDLRSWTPAEVEAEWDAWEPRLPEPMRPRFACGAAMFLCELGAVDRARHRLSAIVKAHGDEVLPKWRYLITERASLMQRYQPLVEVIQRCA